MCYPLMFCYPLDIQYSTRGGVGCRHGGGLVAVLGADFLIFLEPYGARKAREGKSKDIRVRLLRRVVRCFVVHSEYNFSSKKEKRT